MLDTLSILEQFETNVGAQMEQVLDLWCLDCPFGGHFGVLQLVKFEVPRRQMPCHDFVVKYQLPKGSIVQVAHRVLNVFSQYKMTFLKMIA